MGMMQDTNRVTDPYRLETTTPLPEGHRFHPALGVTSVADAAQYRRSLSPGIIIAEQLTDREIVLMPASELGLRVVDTSSGNVATSTKYYAQRGFRGVLSKSKS